MFTTAPDIDTATVHDFKGRPLAKELRFDKPAPDEIGRVIAADSTAKTGQSTTLHTRSFITMVLWLLPVVALAFALSHTSSGVRLLGLGMAAVFVGMALSKWHRHRYAYVGEEGVARYDLPGLPGLPPFTLDKRANSVFRFDEAESFYTNITRNYYNGIYAGTDSEFTWINGDSKTVYTVKSYYWSSKDTPQEDSLVYLGRAAADVWNERVLNRVRASFAETGEATFRYRVFNGGVTVLRDAIRIVRLNKETLIERHELAAVEVVMGQIKFRRVGEKPGFFDEGPGVGFSEVANAQVLLQLIQENFFGEGRYPRF